MTPDLPERYPPRLLAALRAVNAGRLTGGPAPSPAELTTDAALERELRSAGERLAVYGTLAPGRLNHHLLRPYPGRWSTGIVRGTLYAAGWGAALAAPGMAWQTDGDPIDVHLLESAALPGGWTRLDAFEGDEYARLLVPIEMRGGVRVANIYALRAESLRLA